MDSPFIKEGQSPKSSVPIFKYLVTMTGKLPKDLMEDSYPDPVPTHPDDVGLVKPEVSVAPSPAPTPVTEE